MYDGMSMSDHKQWNGDVAVGKSIDGSLDRSANYPINPSIEDGTLTSDVIVTYDGLCCSNKSSEEQQCNKFVHD